LATDASKLQSKEEIKNQLEQAQHSVSKGGEDMDGENQSIMGSQANIDDANGASLSLDKKVKRKAIDK